MSHLDVNYKYGYVEKYKIFADKKVEIWKRFTLTEDGSVGLYLIDKKAFENNELVDKIHLLLNLCVSIYSE